MVIELTLNKYFPSYPDPHPPKVGEKEIWTKSSLSRKMKKVGVIIPNFIIVIEITQDARYLYILYVLT
jgi:hypothetical protein